MTVERPRGIVFLSHTARSSAFRIGSHHLARELSARGHTVAHISNPISPLHLRMIGDPEVRARARLAVPLRARDIDGAHHLVPWATFPLGLRPTHGGGLGSQRLLVRELRRLGLARPDLVLIDQPMLHYLLDPIGARRVVYRPTDIVSGSPVLEDELTVLRRADGLITTSQPVLDHALARHHVARHGVVENGVEYDRFHLPAPGWDERRGAVYVGALDVRFDWAAVAAMGRAHPDVPIDLYGPRPVEVPPLPPNVRLHGEIPYDDVPAALARHRVGLLPLADVPVNAGRSPMKLYEYLAAGLGVVSPRTRSLDDGVVAGLVNYDRAQPDAAGLALAEAARVAPPDEADALARSMDWSARAAMVLRLCGDLLED